MKRKSKNILKKIIAAAMLIFMLASAIVPAFASSEGIIPATINPATGVKSMIWVGILLLIAIAVLFFINKNNKNSGGRIAKKKRESQTEKLDN